MKITILGCGNAFSNKSFNQSFLIEENGRKMLVDCGMQTPQALAHAGYKAQDINDIYISHLHADHVGGLEYFAFTRYDWKNHPRSYKEGNYAPKLIGNIQLLHDAWDKTLRGGLESMEGFVATLETFFEPVYVEPNHTFEWQGWTVNLIQQIHIMSGSMIMPSFGIMFSKEGHKTVYFVTDCQHCSPRQMEEYYSKADVIFQDCECTGIDFYLNEGDPYYVNESNELIPYASKTESRNKRWKCFRFGSNVHANYAQLAGYDSANSVKLSKETKAKMYLSHYQDFVLENKDMYGNNIIWQDKAKEDGFAGFAGFVKIGNTFEV